MKHKPRYRLIAAVGAASLLPAACGSSSPSGSATATTASAGSAATHPVADAARKGPINLMIIYTQHSASYSQPYIGDAAQAAVNVVNAQGGVNGHALKLIECNDGSDPNLATQCGIQAMSDHVSSLVGTSSVFSSNFYPYLQQGHIANLGDSPLTATDNTNSLSFPFGTIAPVQYAALGEMMANAGCKKIAVLGPDIAAIKESVQNFDAGVRSVSSGISLPPTINFPLGNPNDAPQAEKVASLGADCAIGVTDSPDMAALLPQIRQLAPNVKVGWIDSVLNPDALVGLGSATSGALVTGQAAPLGTSTPATTEFISAMKKYFPKDVANNQSENSWAAVMAFVQVAKGLSSYSSSTVLAALSRQCELKVPLFTTVDFCHAGPIAKAPRIFNTTSYQLSVSKGEYVLAKPTPIQTATALATSPGL